MKNKLSVALLALVLTGLTVTAASAHPSSSHHDHHHGYYGPGFFPSVNLVIAAGDNDDNRYISLSGHVFRKTGDDSYLFTDGNNTYQLNCDNSELPVGRSIVIGGQLDDGQIDIRKWHYAE